MSAVEDFDAVEDRAWPQVVRHARTMTEEAARALRAPFPPESIGKLPKGGTTLDYVGHAATTDRLLSVDPEWNWEPVAWTPEGLPLIAGGQLWIRLTVCGVTRLGVGDGASDKERIGDAIRNAAMRFGVALDLWAKEDLSPIHDGSRSVLEAKRELLAIATAAGRADAKDLAAQVWKTNPPEKARVTVDEWDTLTAALDALLVEDSPAPSGDAGSGSGAGGDRGGPGPVNDHETVNARDVAIGWTDATEHLRGRKGVTAMRDQLRHAAALFVTSDPARWHANDLTDAENLTLFNMASDLAERRATVEWDPEGRWVDWTDETGETTRMPVPTDTPTLEGVK